MNNNPFCDLLHDIRKEGAYKNPPDIELGSIRSTAPLTVSFGGAVLTDEIYLPTGLQSALEVNDLVALKRVGEKNIILARVVKAR